MLGLLNYLLPLDGHVVIYYAWASDGDCPQEV